MAQEKIGVYLSGGDWSTVQAALHTHGGEIAASEARRTGGMGFASAGKARHLEDVLRIRKTIRETVNTDA